MTFLPRVILCYTLLLFFHSSAFSSIEPQSGKFRMRARETYNWLKFEGQGEEEVYRGLSNTFNLFYEKPFNYSYGLAFGSLLSSLSASTTLTGLSKDIFIYFIGFETKVFFLNLGGHGFFARPGVFYHQIQNEGARGNLDGVSLLTGVGYEFLITKSVSLAPELSLRSGESGPFSWQGLTFSLGVHFYQL